MTLSTAEILISTKKPLYFISLVYHGNKAQSMFAPAGRLSSRLMMGCFCRAPRHRMEALPHDPV